MSQISKTGQYAKETFRFARGGKKNRAQLTNSNKMVATDCTVSSAS
jgi:hypothetical protein